MSLETDTRINKSKTLLINWLNSRVDPDGGSPPSLARHGQVSIDGLAWLKRQLAENENSASAKTLFTSYSAVPRYLGKAKLELSAAELQAAKELINGWNPIDWTYYQVGRTLLLISFPYQNSEKYLATLDKIVAAADVAEAIAFYQSLPLLPNPEQFQLRAAEGIRSNMTSVFNAVALNNPYPAEYLNDLAWNQMVLKALFVGSPLHLIYGLQRRNNQQLSQMLIDYARERLAANRTVSSQLWELVMPFQSEVVAKLKPSSAVVAS